MNTPIYYATLKDWKDRLTFPLPRKLGEVQATEVILKGAVR